jgi:purine-cytosine permease-like protein
MNNSSSKTKVFICIVAIFTLGLSFTYSLWTIFEGISNNLSYFTIIVSAIAIYLFVRSLYNYFHK